MNNENAGVSNTENLGFKVVSMGREEIDNRRPCNLRPLTLAKLYDWIDSKRIDSRLKEELKKSAGSYPQQALLTWQRTYAKHLAKAQNMLRDKAVPPPENVVELGDEPYIKRDSYEEENNVPDNDFDAGWENSGEDQSRQPAIHPDVQDEGIGGSRPHSQYPAE
jgi:hypothetical protein